MGSYCDRCKKDGYVTEVGNFMSGTEEELCKNCYSDWKKERDEKTRKSLEEYRKKSSNVQEPSQ